MRRSTLGFLGAVSVIGWGCGSSTDAVVDESVAETDAGSGGALGVGGKAGSAGAGGSQATGGAVGSGGVKGTGGSTATGGVANSGGSLGTGGANSSGGTPIVDAGPVVVHPCSSLPSTTQWEKITPPGDVGDSQAVRVHPTESGTVFVDMHKGGNGAHYPTDGLYKSSDCGASWTKVSTGRNWNDVTQGSWWSFVIDPVDPNVMYTIDGYGTGGVWKSTNAGLDWDQTIPNDVGQYIPSLFLNGLSMDPTDPRHLVASVHVTCTGPYAGGCMPETFDGGATWRIIKGPLTGWGEGTNPIVINATTILFAANEWAGLYLTKDSGASWSKVASSSWGGFHRGPDGTFYVGGGTQGVFKSTDLVTWTSIPGGTVTTLTGSDTDVYGADQWHRSYFTAPMANPTTLSPLTTAGISSDVNGSPYLDYDRGHHILYSSCFGGGLWRIVTQ